jgi:hypothetical protein
MLSVHIVRTRHPLRNKNKNKKYHIVGTENATNI